MFKIRASAAGKIMTNSRSKSEPLSKTTQSYLQEWYKHELYGHRKNISNKYLTKGIEMEDEAIEKVIEWSGTSWAEKNEDHFEDDFFTGTPDLLVDDTVFDTKCSWDCFTFPLFETEIPTKDYFYQLQIYMHLTGVRKAVLAYVLLNTPDELTYEEQHDYDSLPKELRYKTFDVAYDEKVIEAIQERVKECRNYLETIKIK